MGVQVHNIVYYLTTKQKSRQKLVRKKQNKTKVCFDNNKRKVRLCFEFIIQDYSLYL